jgi:hypothetical protein
MNHAIYSMITYDIDAHTGQRSKFLINTQR